MNVHEEIAAELQNRPGAMLVTHARGGHAELQRGHAMAIRSVYVYVAPWNPEYSVESMQEFKAKVLGFLPDYSFQFRRDYSRTGDRVLFGEVEGSAMHMATRELLSSHDIPLGGGLMMSENMKFSLLTRIYVRTVPDSRMLQRVKPSGESLPESLRLDWHDKFRAWMK